VEVTYQSSLNQLGADNLVDVCAAATARSKMLMKNGFYLLGLSVDTVRLCVCLCAWGYAHEHMQTHVLALEVWVQWPSCKGVQLT